MSSASFRTAALALGLLFALGQANPPAFAQDEDPEAFDIESRTGKGIKLRKMEEVDLQSEYQRLAEQKRLESIERLKSAARTHHGVEDETKAEMMLRLAELYFEQGRYLYLKEMEVFDRHLRGGASTPTPATPRLLKPDNSGSARVAGKGDQALREHPAELPAVCPRRPGHVLPGLGADRDVGREDDAVGGVQAAREAVPGLQTTCPTRTCSSVSTTST